MIELYIAFGLGMYVGMCLKDPNGFVDADAAGLIRGFLLCCVFWPLGLLLQLIIIGINIYQGKDLDS